MKSKLLAFAAVTALAGATGQAALAADQTPAEPAGTRFAPQPTIEEELVYLRDIIALQTLRLDEAEQALERQSALIEAQQSMIAALETRLSGLGSGAVMAAAGAYTVQDGDTLYAIAQRHGSSVERIAAANDLSAPYRLRVGQRLDIPGSAPAAAPVAVAQAAPQQQPPAAAPEAQTAPAEPAPQQRVASAEVSPGERPDVSRRAVEAERDRREAETGAQERLPSEVGVRPDEESQEPYVAIFSDVGGILTPKGAFYAEPAVDFTVTSDNRFFFQGVEIIDAILIGAIEATDSDRRAITESLGVRYGLTNRLEIDARVAHIHRHDRISGVAIDDATTSLRELDGSGLGDAEVGLHYQLNRGRRFPYAILNMRAKAPTGLGPFDVARSADSGIELELATGSGYWTLEPSLTLIAPTDPAVVFANIGYQANLATTPDAELGGTIVREYNPGDAIRTSIGVGLSLNERMSMNFGYDQSFIFQSETLIESTNSRGEPVLTLSRQPAATVGAFLFGGSYAVSDRLRLNLNTAIGATDEAPDVRVSLRAQIKLFD